MTDTFLSPSSGADPRIGQVLQERYRIVRKLGEGGMGAVYEGEHLIIKKRVAIKCLHAQFATNPEIVARFHREALATTQIGHPNIVEVMDMGRFADGAVFMVLEFLEGRDWAHDIQATGPQPIGRVAHILAQVCDAVGAAHAKNIVHRDLKPENIFLLRRGDEDFVKVLDFGISKMRGEGGENKGLTRTGTAMGTPYYMSPEQAQGKREVDHRADIYSLGVILYQALTAQYPFDDESYPMLVLKICMEAPPPVTHFRPDVPADLEALCARMLAKKPDERPQSCAEIKAALAPYRAVSAAPVVNTQAAPTANAPSILEQMQAGMQTGQLGVVQRHSTATPLSASNVPTPSGMTGAMPIPGQRSAMPMVLGGVAVVAVLVLGGVGAVMSGALAGDPPVEPQPVVHVATQPPPEVPEHATPPPEVPATPPPVAVQPPPVAAEVRTVRVQIETTPPDAHVILDGRPMPNPFDGDLPQTTDVRRLEISREGYVTLIENVSLEFGQRIRRTLRRGRGTDDQTGGARAGSRGTTASEGTASEGTTTTAATVIEAPRVEAPPPPPPEPRVETPPPPPPQTTGRPDLMSPF